MRGRPVPVNALPSAPVVGGEERRTRNRRTVEPPGEDFMLVAAADFMLGSGSEVARRSGRVICLSVSLPRGTAGGEVGVGGGMEGCQTVTVAAWRERRLLPWLRLRASTIASSVGDSASLLRPTI